MSNAKNPRNLSVHIDDGKQAGANVIQIRERRCKCCYTDAKYWVILCIGIVATIMICTMVPSSFYGVEYDEYAISRDKLYNKIDYSHVYNNGYHFLGLNYEMIKFPRVFQFEVFSGNQLTVFSKEGLEFPFQCSYQWQPIKEAIPSIHKLYRLSYAPQVKNRVIAVIKNTATRFTTDDFVRNRDLIDDAISHAVTNSVKELGFNIPYDKFQLDKPLIPDTVRSKYLQTQVQLVKNDEQTLRQQQAAVLQQTDVLVKNINANATRVLAEATSNADRIIAEAKAGAFNIINSAEQFGLYSLFSGLNITNATTRALLRQVIAIEESNGVKLYIGGKPTGVINM